MTDRPSDPTLDLAAVGPERRLARIAGGGFEFRGPGAAKRRFNAGPGGWAESGGDGWAIEHTERGGLRLLRDDGSEAARSMSLEGGVPEPNLYYLLWDDGRLFRIRLRATGRGGFELSGWEVVGAYLIATPESDGWRIVQTPASSGLAEVDALSILFAAQILDSEESV